MAKYKNFELNIFGEKWKVKFGHPIHDTRGDEVSGLCDFNSKSLLIDDKGNKKYVSITLIHELFHAYVSRCGLNNANISCELEEIIADQFATVLCENFDFKI